MAITSIVRDLLSNYIVRVTASDNLATVAGAGYVTAQIPNTTALNHGLWDWQAGDLIDVAASDGNQLFHFAGVDFSSFITLPGGNGAVTLPVVDHNFAVFDGTLGALEDIGFAASDASKSTVVMAGSAVVVNHIAKFIDTAGTIDDTAGAAINSGNIQAGLSGTAGTLGSFPSAATSGELLLAAVTNSSGNFNTTISNAAAVGQSQVVSIPDSGSATANFIISKSAGTQHVTSGSLQVDAGDISAGLAAGGTQGRFLAYSATGSKGALILAPVANTGNTNTTISNAAMGQASVISIPDPGAATANFLLDTGTNASGTFTAATITTANITNLKYGATPVAQVDPASCTITAAAGISNVANVTVQLKDGSGTNMARSIGFRVYASSAADGLTLASAASTGFAVSAGGLSLANGTAVTTQISAMSSATGGCSLTLTDTGKQTSYLVLVLPNGNKISAQLTSGSYGA